VKALLQAFRTPDQDGFGILALGELRALGREAHYDQEQFALRVQPGAQIINLVNLYRDYLATPRLKRAELLANQLRSVLAAGEPIPKTWSEARSGLLPLVRHRGELEYVRYAALVEGSDFEEMISKPVSDQLFAAVAYDSPTSVSRGSPALLNDWGVSLDVVWEETLENLRKRSPDNWIEVTPGVYQSGWQDVYDISRMLLPEVLYRLPIAGRPVVFTPERNALILTGDRSESQLVSAAKCASEILVTASRQLTAHPLVLDGKAWLPFVLPSDAAAILTPLWQQERAELYEQARPFIEKILEMRGQDIFVAGVLAVRKGDDGPITHIATWPSGCDTLLPVVDVVAMDDRGTVRQIPWRLLKATGVIDKPDREWWPPRFRVKDYPGRDTLKMMFQAGSPDAS
jgi:hypothetical protein